MMLFKYSRIFGSENDRENYLRDKMNGNFWGNFEIEKEISIATLWINFFKQFSTEFVTIVDYFWIKFQLDFMQFNQKSKEKTKAHPHFPDILLKAFCRPPLADIFTFILSTHFTNDLDFDYL